MRTKVFILCAGDDTRYPGVVKQLLDVGGEEILRRIIRLLRMRYKDEIYIVTHNSAIKNNIKNLNDNKVIIFEPNADRFHMETVYSTKEEWTDKNIFLFGDVIFTNAAVKKILGLNNKLYFFVRIEPHIFTDKIFAEPYGMSIPESESIRIINIISKSLKKTTDAGRLYILSDIYKELGIDIEKEFKIKPVKERRLISKLCLNDTIRIIAYNLFRSYEGWIMRHVIYRFFLSEKWKNLFIRILLGKIIPAYDGLSEYLVEIHDATDDVDYPREYKDYIRLVVKKGLLK